MSKFGKRLMLKEHFGGKIHTRQFCPRDNLDTADRVATEIKEIIVNADLIKFKDFGPDRCKQLLYESTRCCKTFFQFRSRVIKSW